MAAGDVVFSCGGIGNTPDDHTRQAVAGALGVDLVLHPEGYEELKARFNGEEINDQRRLLVTFPAGVQIIPNPFNRIPGFMVNDALFRARLPADGASDDRMGARYLPPRPVSAGRLTRSKRPSC